MRGLLNYDRPRDVYKRQTVDDLLERSAGENPYSGRTPAERAVEKLAEDFAELTEMIVRREEWMAATAIFTGQIPIIGEGLNEVIDFNFTNTETIVTDALKWTSPTADPLADLEPVSYTHLVRRRPAFF